MAGMATIQIIGNLGRDPETRFTTNGQQVTSFSVAVSRPARGGDRQEETDWYRVSCFGKQAQIAEQFLSKGRKVYISGRFVPHTFTGNDGQSRTSLDVNADTLVLIDSAPRAGLPGDEPVAQGTRSRPAPREFQGDEMTEDDLPF